MVVVKSYAQQSKKSWQFSTHLHNQYKIKQQVAKIILISRSLKTTGTLGNVANAI